MSLKVLIVEDDEILRGLLIKGLDQEGIYVRGAGSCAEARILVEQGQPDLLVLDINLPDGNGLALLEQLRQAPFRLSVPVVVMSSLPITRGELRQHAVDTFMPKPLSVQTFVHKVQTILAGNEKSGPGQPPHQ